MKTEIRTDLMYVDNPILISDDILTKAGFKHKGAGRWEHPDWLPYLQYRHHQCWQVFNVADCMISYVHQLKLIFALTNFGSRELDI